MYGDLKSFAYSEDQESFCDLVKRSQLNLDKIYNDDYALNQELIKDGQDFSIDYAKKIYENSASNIFAINNYMQACEAGEVIPLKRIIKDLDRSIENNTILSLSHKMFIQILQGLKSL
jgi:hypothetical protein